MGDVHRIYNERSAAGRNRLLATTWFLSTTWRAPMVRPGERWSIAPVPLPRATTIAPKRYAPARAVRERYGMEGKSRSHNWLQRRLKDPSFPKPALKIAGRYYWDVDDLEAHETAQRKKIVGLWGRS